MEPTAVSRAILGGLIADDTGRDEVAASVTAWIGSHADRVGRHTVAWTAAKSVELGLDAIDAGAAAIPTPAQLSVFRNLPVGSRVVVALHEFCGLGDDEVARVTARPIAEVKVLLDTVGELGAAWGLAEVGFTGGSLDGTRGGQQAPGGYG